MVQGPGPSLNEAVAAVVVSYNARRHLRSCLASIAAEQVKTTIVVDNGSVDGSQSVVEDSEAVWFPTGANLGYGRAANLGAGSPAAADAAFLLVCNPDLEVEPGALATLVKALESDESLGVVGPRIVNPDGSLYPSARSFPNLVDALGHGLFGLVAPGNRFTRRYRLLDWDHASARKVDWISGACFVARREAWDAVGGFDPSYFMYLEDVDLCWRLGRAGWTVGYEPGATVVHTQGASTDQHPYRMLLAHHRSLWQFAWRTTTGARRTALPVVAVGLVGRLAVASARRWLDGTTGTRPGGPLP